MLKDRLARVARRVSQDATECNRDMGIAYRMTRSTRRPRRAAAGIAATVALGLLLGGCFSETYQRGYIVPDGALEQIPIGSTQEQVLIVLGTPSTVATVSGEAFYYISQRSERPIGFMPQRVVDQRVVAIYFDKGRRVERLANYGLKDGKVFDFVSRTTPTGGKDYAYVNAMFKLF
jgi:outer membrane protein assembly factor BamE (lipoprotein component of BamABCDE complex)